MRRILLFLVTAFASSCTLFPTPDGYGLAMGGKGGHERSKSGATRTFWDNTESFRDAAIATTAVASYGANVALEKTKETTTRVVSGHRSAEVINGQNTAADVAKEGIKGDVIKTVTIPK